jgi:hypothetical protein
MVQNSNLPQDGMESSSSAAGTRVEQLVVHLDRKMLARTLVEEQKAVERALKARTLVSG